MEVVKSKKICKDAVRSYRGISYKVPKLTYYDCPDCQEKVYDPDAIRKIEAYSPAYKALRKKRKSA